MKKVLIIMATLLLNVVAIAQQGLPVFENIPVLPIKVSVQQTTNLIFPVAIRSVDRGSLDILVQKAKGVENVLQVKAATDSFELTNLSVITTDGKLYSFLMSYDSMPAQINYRFGNNTFAEDTLKQEAIIIPTGKMTSEPIIENKALQIASEKQGGSIKKDKRYGMVMALKRIYIHNDVIFFRLELANRTFIDFDVEMLHCTIKDEELNKRTASQEIVQEPVYTYGDASIIKGHSSSVIVLAIPKFTIPNKKVLVVQLMEKNGGRHLEFIIKNKVLIKAKPV